MQLWFLFQQGSVKQQYVFTPMFLQIQQSSLSVCTKLCNCEADEDECQNTQQPAAEEDSEEEWKASAL